MVAHTFGSSIWEAEAQESPDWGRTGLHMRWFLKQTHKNYQANKNQYLPDKQQIMLELTGNLFIFSYSLHH